MNLIVRYVTTSVMLLLIIPILIWISGWQWSPNDNTWYVKALFLVGETVTKPWVIITHTLLSLGFLCKLRFKLLKKFIIFSMISIIILLGQGIKLWMKVFLHDVRPFIIWLENVHHIPIDKFYSLKYNERKDLIKSQLSHEEKIPVFLRNHWKKEIDFSCPSGHAIFSASWALFGAGLFGFRRNNIIVFILLLWSSAVIGSRMLLGMHRPWEVIVSILIAWIMVIFSIYFVKRFYRLEMILHIQLDN